MGNNKPTMNEDALQKAVAIIVHGPPVAKGRPRFGRSRAGETTVYTPQKTQNYEDMVRQAAVKAMRGRAPLDGPVSVAIDVYLPVPKSWSAVKTEQALHGFKRPTTRPDIDNFAKAAMDACNRVVFYDDSQIVRLFVSKRYGENPRLEIAVAEKDA